MKSLAAALLMGLFSVVAWAPPANADVVAYLVNVHVRPGYNFPNADAAIGYGNTICDRVAAKMSYAQLVDQVKADFNTADYYQGAYLINQAVNELCPAQIWLHPARLTATLFHDNGGAPTGYAAVASNWEYLATGRRPRSRTACSPAAWG
jgi:hypothetical protein